ncbi:DUF2088 domain-containing protein [bacterium]|nr:DUF2088 domain-containing protein [bacterium]
MPWFYEEAESIGVRKKQELIQRLIEQARERITKDLKKVLLLPPDITRHHSGAGQLTEMIYRLLPDGCKVDVIPTLGQHVPHTDKENKWMFGSIPLECFHVHDWRKGCKKIGEVSADYVKEASDGKADWPIPVEINRMVIENDYDLIINIGHVVPHEVLGFANHNKNYFIGLGGKETICASHMMAACCGIENNLGQLITPVRACYNKAEEDYLNKLPDVYVLIVMARNEEQELVPTGLYVGDDMETYLMAAGRSKEQNITVFDEPIKKIVAVMQADEFKSTWVANKAIYRTRMALADKGELLIIAPGLERFGEQPEVDALIRKYGYGGTSTVMEQYKKNNDLQDLAHAAAHLIHGSSESRFTITYAPGKLTREEIENVNFEYVELDDALNRYNPEKMSEGWNTMPDGEKVYFISSPSAGLWAWKKKLQDRLEK